MTVNLQTTQKSLYETDYMLWIETNLERLKAQDYNRVDWDNLYEEIEDMSRRERQSLDSNLIIILLHLLKWQYQPEYRSGSWKGSIREHRRRVNKALKDSPSLKTYFQDILAECYANSREQAADETSLPLNCFPVNCLYTSEEILDSNFLPQ